MKMYVIKSTFKNGSDYSFSEYTLGEDLKWYLACNRPAGFQTVGQARNFATKHRITETRPVLGSDSLPYIVGPKGGKTKL